MEISEGCLGKFNMYIAKNRIITLFIMDLLNNAYETPHRVLTILEDFSLTKLLAMQAMDKFKIVHTLQIGPSQYDVVLKDLVRTFNNAGMQLL
jgi:hypothetical protein